MTATQMMRYERRVAKAAQERREREELVAAILALLLILTAFAIAGTMDFHDEARDLAYWRDRGVIVQRW